jgi:hypothetical protein
MAPYSGDLEADVNARIPRFRLVAALVTLTALATPTPAHADPPAPAGAPAPSITRSHVALVAAGVAVVGAAVGTVFGVLALQNKSDYAKGPTYSNSDDGNNDAAYADGGIALAVAAGITSLVLFLTSDDSAADGAAAGASKKVSAGLSAAPFVTPRGGGAGAVLRF